MANSRFDDLEKQHVVRAARKIEPKGVRKWGVEVDGTEFPVKQIYLEAVNLIESSAPKATPADFISHTAVHKLRKLGLNVKYHG